MNLSDKHYLEHTVNYLKIRMLSFTEFIDEVESFKKNCYERMELSLVIVYRKEYIPPNVINGCKIYSSYKKDLHLYKGMVRRVAKFETPGKMISQHTIGGSVTSKFEKQTVFDIGLGKFQYASENWDIEFIRGLKSDEYGKDWWICYKL